MTPKPRSFRIRRVVAFASLAIVALVVLLRIGGCVLAFQIAGSKTPRVVLGELVIFVAGALGIAIFPFWKFVIAAVSWIDMSMIFMHVTPWDLIGIHGFFSQFTTDLIFFIAANVAAITYRRRASVVGVSHDPVF